MVRAMAGIRPLPLGLDGDMTANLGKSDLNRPTADEPAKDVERIHVEISAQKSLWLELNCNVANKHITDRHQASGGCQIAVPETLQQPFAAAMPSVHLEASPACARIGETLRQCGLTAR